MTTSKEPNWMVRERRADDHARRARPCERPGCDGIPDQRGGCKGCDAAWERGAWEEAFWDPEFN